MPKGLGGVKAGGDDDDAGLPGVGDGEDNGVEGGHVVGVAGTLASPGDVDGVADARALARLIDAAGARVEPTAHRQGRGRSVMKPPSREQGALL